MCIAVIQCTTVVRAHHEETRCLRIKARQNFLNTEKITQTLGHLFVITRHKTVVHPMARQGFAAGSLALGDFVFVVRKLQVRATAVDVKGFAQKFAGHR